MPKNTSISNLDNFCTSALIDALRKREDVLAIKVWTRQDCEDVARQLVESRTPDGSIPEERVRKIADGMMANRYSGVLNELRDCKDAEWDALWEHCSNNDDPEDPDDRAEDKLDADLGIVRDEDGFAIDQN